MACKHQTWEPVELAVTGEKVANVCSDCLRELPIDYEGDVVAIRTFGRAEPVAYLPA